MLEVDHKGQYFAEKRLSQLMEEQHLLPTAIRRITPWSSYRQWSWFMAIWTLIISWAGMIPQLILQRQSNQILQLSLVCLPESTAQRQDSEGVDQQGPEHTPRELEQQIQKQKPITEKGQNPRSDKSSVFDDFLLRQTVIFGTIAVGLGYVGCFNSAQNSSILATYVWLLGETGLSLLRAYLWGLNPPGDDETGIDIELELTTPARLEGILFIDSDELSGVVFKNASEIAAAQPSSGINLPYIPCIPQQFLKHIARSFGPISRFIAPHHIKLSFALIWRADSSQMALLTIVLDLQTDNVLLFIQQGVHTEQGGMLIPPVVCQMNKIENSAKYILIPLDAKTTSIENLGDEVDVNVFSLARYCNQLMELVGPPANTLTVSWTLHRGKESQKGEPV
ncbi:hypothetical protein C8J57DRAFT_1245044 [Mycena rebaudengoi]|nr:hypothetical protein C8J57DRAFT_1245044 [Mycena rebaudengoi]